MKPWFVNPTSNRWIKGADQTNNKIEYDFRKLRERIDPVTACSLRLLDICTSGGVLRNTQRQLVSLFNSYASSLNEEMKSRYQGLHIYSPVADTYDAGIHPRFMGVDETQTELAKLHCRIRVHSHTRNDQIMFSSSMIIYVRLPSR